MNKSRLTVFYDIKRLIDAEKHSAPYWGITRYVRSLLEATRNLSDEVQIVPVYYPPMSRKTHDVRKATSLVENRLGIHIRDTSSGGLAETVESLSDSGYSSAQSADTCSILSRLLKFRKRHLPAEGSASRDTDYVDEGASSGSPRRYDRSGRIYHSPVNPLPPLTWTKDITRVLTVHDVLHLKFPEYYPHQGKTPAIRKTLDSIGRNDYIICDSENTRKDLISFIPVDEERVSVIPLAGDPLFQKPDRSFGLSLLKSIKVIPGKYVLALAQSEKRKNIPRLIEAFRILISGSRHADYSLLLLTSKINAQKIRSQIKSVPLLEKNVKILVDIDDPKLASLYSHATVFAFVPLYEGFGIPPLEAMASGCPVVVANNSSIPEVVGDAGVYVNAESAESIAEGLSSILGNASLRASLISAGRKQSGHFSWEKTARATLNFYRKALQS
jgi:glycosyltransferase involved in cell wall biosynthesis